MNFDDPYSSAASYPFGLPSFADPEYVTLLARLVEPVRMVAIWKKFDKAVRDSRLGAEDRSRAPLVLFSRMGVLWQECHDATRLSRSARRDRTREVASAAKGLKKALRNNPATVHLHGGVNLLPHKSQRIVLGLDRDPPASGGLIMFSFEEELDGLIDLMAAHERALVATAVTHSTEGAARQRHFSLGLSAWFMNTLGAPLDGLTAELTSAAFAPGPGISAAAVKKNRSAKARAAAR